jgi:hypothetical protein
VVLSSRDHLSAGLGDLHTKGPGPSKRATDNDLKQTEKHHNAAEEGDTANIRQNKTNKGFFRGRRER